jgi:protein-S-isoprenylcysteine O-methyltransferase Ste14
VLLFLGPLVLGFAIDAASAFTTALSRRWGERRGQQVTFVLRNLLGIPLWVVGLGLAVRVRSSALFAITPLTEILGWLLRGAGSVIQVLALFALRARAAMPSPRDTLVQHGPYARIRHPIYAGLLLEFAGLVLLRPTGATVLACAIGFFWVFVQARLEEVDLLQRFSACRKYMEQVPRFLPRVRARRPWGEVGRRQKDKIRQ